MGETCGGCKFHSFPYKACLPISVDGKRQTKTFNCKEDVWDVIDLLIREVKEMNTKGKEFDVSESINAQLPFFSCRNILFDKNIQKDIQRYIYCKELGIPPYEGSYGKQPAVWVDTFFIIKSSFAKRESSQINKIKDKKV